MDSRLLTATRTLRLAIGLMATLAGLDKFFNLLTDWSRYVSPAAAHLLPFSTEVLMPVIGVVELGVGIVILTALPVAGAYVASGWLLLVAANLTVGGHFDIAVRDAVLSVAAFALARLSVVRAAAAAGSAEAGCVPSSGFSQTARNLS